MSEPNDKTSPHPSAQSTRVTRPTLQNLSFATLPARPLPELLLFFRLEILDVKDLVRLVAASLAQKFLVERLDGRVHV